MRAYFYLQMMLHRLTKDRSGQFANAYLQIVAAGSITGPKTHTSRSGDEKARWPGSETSRPCKNSLSFMPRFTTTAIKIATSTAEIFLWRTAPPRSLSGANWQLEKFDCI
ncbi:MAG: hypothetical protein GKS02_04450 [Alphaproteobacteria bacterium]|nr:hypothetical protein [Alphaproteobacteria bacterium]